MLGLGLCEDPETNIWYYYSTVKLTPHCSSRLFNANFDCPSCRPISSDEFIQGTYFTYVSLYPKHACSI